MTAPATLPPPSDRATSLLAEQRAGLEAAIATFELDPLGRPLITARKMLAQVTAHQSEMQRDPEFFALLVLGFMGENGYAPLIRSIVEEAAKLRAPPRFARTACLPTAEPRAASHRFALRPAGAVRL